MREAHAHIAAYGQSLAMPDLSACRSVGECLALVARTADSTAPRGWVRLLGARIEAWDEPRWPRLDELDRAAAGRPCIIMSFDHHAACANSAALAASGLRAGDVVAPNGLVMTDRVTGRATGELIEQAAFRVWESAPEPSPDQWKRHVLSALNALARLGYTEVHDLHSQDWLGPVLSELEREGTLPVREVRLYPPVSRLEAVHHSRAAWESPRVRLAGGKVFADGTLNSRTALMLEPYREPLNGQPFGRAMVAPGEIERAVELCESLGMHLAVHAIGDGAVRMVLDAFDRACGDRVREPGNRHRIEHAELIDQADVPRFVEPGRGRRGRGGIVCSVQPCHLLADVEVLHRQLPHRLHRVLPLRELIDAGCTPGGDGALLWFGSDAPIVRPDAGDSIRAAVDRRREGLPETDAIAWASRIREDEAVAAFGGRGF